MDDKRYWLGFNIVKDIGPVRFQQLLKFFETPAAAWQASEADLSHAGLPSHAIQRLVHRRKQVDLDQEMARVAKLGARIITWADAEYPAELRKLSDAPPVLYIRGRLTERDKRSLAVVGTRKATRYGIDAARQLSRELAAQRITIISGLALGIDGAAHEGALDTQEGRTIAVLGNSIDRIYPRENQALAQKIVERGAIISEFPLGTPPSGQNFPRRNRLLSGLALGVLVVEAPERSGALITASAALEQGRDVFAVPANIFNQTGAGSNRLIQDGAKLVMNAADILDELNISMSKGQTRTQAEIIAPGSELEVLVLQVLDADPIHVDDIIRISGLATEMVTATLTILELKGLAQSSGNMEYCRTR